MPELYVRDAGVWKNVTIAPFVRGSTAWPVIRKLWVATQALNTAFPPVLVTTWNRVHDYTVPSIFPPGKNIRTGVGIGPDPHIDVDWTPTSNTNADEFYYNVSVELWNGGTLIDTQIVDQSLGTVHWGPSTFGGTRPTVFGRLRYRNKDTGSQGPSTDTSSVVVQG